MSRLYVLYMTYKDLMEEQRGGTQTSTEGQPGNKLLFKHMIMIDSIGPYCFTMSPMVYRAVIQ